MLPVILLLLIPFLQIATSSEYSYSLNTVDDEAMTDCVLKGINFIEDGTCLTLTESTADPYFTVQQSTDCSWQPSNRTIHLAPGCLRVDTCIELIGKALNVHHPKHELIHFVNQAFNCSTGCSLHCEHGGSLNREGCTCSCGYGFEGARCEKLTRARHFTDESCGEVLAEDAGSLSLSTFPGSQQKATFCQWLLESEDPWATLEVSFETLDLDGDEIPAGQSCNDVLTMYGGNYSGMIPCDGINQIPSVVYSDSNWLLIELRTNPWSLKPHAGPNIKYRLHTRRPHGIRAFADEMTSATSATALLSTPLLLWLTAAVM